MEITSILAPHSCSNQIWTELNNNNLALDKELLLTDRDYCLFCCFALWLSTQVTKRTVIRRKYQISIWNLEFTLIWHMHQWYWMGTFLLPSGSHRSVVRATWSWSLQTPTRLATREFTVLTLWPPDCGVQRDAASQRRYSPGDVFLTTTIHTSGQEKICLGNIK